MRTEEAELSFPHNAGAVPAELFAQQTIMAPPPHQDGAPPLPSPLHGGLLPHPMVVQHAGPHPLMQQNVMQQQHGGETHPGLLIPRPDFMSSSRQQRNPHGFVPHHQQHRQVYKHHSQSGFYQWPILISLFTVHFQFDTFFYFVSSSTSIPALCSKRCWTVEYARSMCYMLRLLNMLSIMLWYID